MLPRLLPLRVRHTEELSGSKAWRRPGESPRKGSVPPEGNAFGVFQRNQQPSQKVQQIIDLQLGKEHREYSLSLQLQDYHIFTVSQRPSACKSSVRFFFNVVGFVFILCTKKQIRKYVLHLQA